MPNKTCIIIAGPTASGKTALAIQVAQALQTEIISADSRQCYRELTIGVAKPSPEQLQAVRHHFINSHSIHQEVNAAVFGRYALAALEEIFRHNATAVVAGGTGLYIKALLEGLDDMPEVSPGIRASIRNRYELHGLEWLQQQAAEAGIYELHRHEITNPNRLMRALEVKLSTGQAIHTFRSPEKKKRDFNSIIFGMQVPRDALYRNINLRVDQMIANGLVEEAQALTACKHLNALNTVGYKELFGYYEGSTTLETAVDAIKKNTRHYAKRQLTWLNGVPSVHWISPMLPELLPHLQGKI